MRAGGLGRSLRWVAACLAAGCLTLALASCGGNSSAATAKAGVGTSKTTTASGRTPQPTPATGGRCATQLGAVLDSMDKLRSRLVAGLAYEQYVGAVKSILAAYEAIPVDELALPCLRATGTPAEKGLNRYIAAGNVWTDCVEVPSCEAASIEADLQGKWHRASEYLSKAQRGLRQQSSG